MPAVSSSIDNTYINKLKIIKKMNETVGRLYFILGILMIVLFLFALRWIQNDIKPAPVTPTREDVGVQNVTSEEETV